MDHSRHAGFRHSGTMKRRRPYPVPASRGHPSRSGRGEANGDSRAVGNCCCSPLSACGEGPGVRLPFARQTTIFKAETQGTQRTATSLNAYRGAGRPFPSRSLCPLCLRGSMPFVLHLGIRSASNKIPSALSAGTPRLRQSYLQSAGGPGSCAPLRTVTARCQGAPVPVLSRRARQI
jgi:hypothetical protein